MVKKLILLLTLFFFTGCSVNYDIYINNDNQVEEIVTIKTNVATKEEYKKLNETVDNEYGYNLSKYNYDYTTSYENGVASYIIKRNSDIENLFKDSLYKMFYEDYELFYSNNIVNFKNVGSNYLDSLFVNKNYESDLIKKEDLNKVEINIKFDNKVLSSNADSYDKNTNTYTWTIERENPNKDINFSYDSNTNILNNNKKSKKTTVKNNDYLKLLIIASLIILSVIIIVIIAKFYNKKENEL